MDGVLITLSLQKKYKNEKDAMKFREKEENMKKRIRNWKKKESECRTNTQELIGEKTGNPF